MNVQSAPDVREHAVVSRYSSVTLNVARTDMNNYATLGFLLYWGIGGSKDFALWDLARRAT